MNSSRNIVLYAVILSLSVLSCNVWGPDLEPIEGDIFFFISETHSMNYYDSIKEPDIVLNMVTEQIYGQKGSLIISRFRVTKNKIVIGIKGAQQGYLCVTGPAYAAEKLEITDGTYELKISYDGSTDFHTVTVTDSMILITEEDAVFTRPETTHIYWRYPPNSFAYKISKYPAEDDFLDSVRTRSSIEEFSFPDSGGRPLFGDISSDLRFFKYENDEDFDTIGSVLKSFTESVLTKYPEAYIGIRNWKTKNFSSYQFR